MLFKKITTIVALLFAVFTGQNAFAASSDAPKENKGVRPHGAPIIKYSSDYGLSMGGHIAIFDYSNGDIKPFKYLYKAQFMMGVNGDYNGSLYFDAPDFLDTDFRFQVAGGIGKIFDYNYFGIGNDTPNVATSAYYQFVRTTPCFLLNAIRNFYGNFYFILGYSYDRRMIKSDPVSKLRSDAPRGFEGGTDSELRLGVSYDSRDNEAMTTKGIFADFFAELPQKWVGSTYNYARFTLTGRNYLEIFPKLVWANRILLKNSVGEVPFYEMASIGGYRHFDGLGGNNTLRGFRQTRFLDRSTILFNEELRIHIKKFYVRNERFDVYLLSFADFGRVFSNMKNFSLNDMHLSAGGGTRICWNKNFVIAPDIGFSKEGYGLYISFGNIF